MLDQANKTQDPRKTGEDKLKTLAVCLNSLCEEWEEDAL